MFTRNIKDTFTQGLLNAVSGVLGEAKKKCSEECKCEACMKEGYMPTNDAPSDKDRKTAGKLGALLKREREAKEKKEPNGVKTEETEVDENYISHAQRKAVWANRADDGKGHPDKKKKMKESNDDVPFEGPYDKPGVRKDKYGNIIKNVAKHLAKKAMKAQKNEEVSLDEENDEGWYTHSQLYGSKKSEKHPKGISAAEWKSGIRWHHGKNKRINIKEEVEHIDELSKDTLKKYKEKARDDFYDADAVDDGRRVGQRYRGLKMASKKLAKEESEQIDELSKATMGRYINRAKDSIDMASYRQGHKEAHGSSSKALEKKLTKRHKGISTAVNKLTKEDAEQIDELSKATMGRYINKAADRMSTQGVTAGLKIAADEKSKKNFDNIAKRQKGIATAVKKLTKEEQDFIDSLNDADAEQIDELSKDTMLKYLSANKKSGKTAQDTGDYDKMTKRMRGTDMAVRKYTANPGSKYVRVPATEETQIDEISDATLKSYSKKALDQSKTLTGDQKVKRQVGARNAIDRLGNNTLAKEEVELDEARGRPRKAGAKDFTIHPKTKEKLMHDNPEHMKKIEALQRNGVIPVQKIEANQHVMQQLQRAKLSMRGGETVNFTHGDSHHVSGEHAAKLLTKYAGMKPNEKEAFQKKIGHSHANLKSEL